MTREPLVPLARAIAAEAARLDIEGICFHIDTDEHAVVIEGERLKSWGPRTVLEASLSRCGLRHETQMPSARIVVYGTDNGTDTDTDTDAATRPASPV